LSAHGVVAFCCSTALVGVSLFAAPAHAHRVPLVGGVEWCDVIKQAVCTAVTLVATVATKESVGKREQDVVGVFRVASNRGGSPIGASVRDASIIDRVARLFVPTQAVHEV